MGEWSDYFEDFPEENPANWVGGRYDPQGAAAAQARQANAAEASAKLRAEIDRIIQKHSNPAASTKKS